MSNQYNQTRGGGTKKQIKHYIKSIFFNFIDNFAKYLFYNRMKWKMLLNFLPSKPNDFSRQIWTEVSIFFCFFNICVLVLRKLLGHVTFLVNLYNFLDYFFFVPEVIIFPSNYKPNLQSLRHGPHLWFIRENFMDFDS